MTVVATAATLREEIAAAFAAGDHRVALDLAARGWADQPTAELLPLAQLLSAHGQNPAATRIVAHLAAQDGATPQLQAYLAQLQWIAGDSDAAVTTLRDCLSRQPGLVGLYVQLGMIHLSAGRAFDAMLAYGTAHSLEAGNQTALIGRACAFRLLTKQRVVDVRLDNVTAKFAVTGRAISVDFLHLTGSFYEAEELAALAPWVARGGVIADVGANLGNHAIYFLRALQPAAMHLFEPNPACVAALTDNFAQNPAHGSEVTIHRCGIGAARGELFFNRHDDLNNGLVPVAGENAEKVPIEPLDAMLQCADFLKIDVEGMELDVLAGAQRIIRESRPVIFIEVQARNRVAFTAWLAPNHYRSLRIFARGDYDNIIAGPTKAENNPTKP